MMRSAYRTTRWLAVSSLTISLGLAGLFPQMVVWADSARRASAHQQPTKCCCGTEDGHCCGMGCCMARQAPAKERCPCPNPQDTRDGQNNPLALAFAKALLGDAGDTSRSGFTHPESENRLAPDASLQAQHVRIDA